MLGIITAVPEERDSVLAKIEAPVKSIIYNVEFVTGKINNVDCILVLSGVGKINASKATQILISEFKFSKKDQILNIGSSGATNPILEIGDVVVASKVAQFDVDVTIMNTILKADYKKGQVLFEKDRFYYIDATLKNLTKNVMEEVLSKNPKYKVYEGPIVTGDIFDNNPDNKLNLYHEFGAFCDEMEGAAVVKTANAAGIPSSIVRSISDKPVNKDEVMYAEFSKLAAHRATDFLDVFTKKLSKM